jgi:hypothetical protein
LHAQDFAAGFPNGARHTLLSTALDQEKHTTTAARATDFGAE